MGYTVDTDQIRATASKAIANSENIASESLTLANKVQALVSGNGFNSAAGVALEGSILNLRGAIAKLVEATNSLSSNANVAAGNYDTADTSAAASLKV